ncbi:MAG: tetratricopeptide repeat protein [Candidatus Melainabacteria bacterium]|nr:tetratricopeptide repeat protein [Candidatus Melainabacteria bacterium]
MSYEPQHDEDKARGVGELLKEAATALKLQRFKDAEDFCVQALGVLDKASALEHPSKAMALEFMGDALTGLERYELAGGFYKRAMDLSERIYSQENQVYISIVYKLARTYESLSLLDECQPYFKLADELAKRHLSAGHPLRDTIADGYAHLVSRTKKRREKVVEIMDSFRSGKDRSAGDRDNQEFDEDGEVDVTQKDAPQHQERHTAPGYKDLREKATLYNNSSESMQMWTSIALLFVVAGLVYVGFQQFFKRTTAVAPSPVIKEEKREITDFVKSYSSLDGKRKLKISTGNTGVVEFGPTKITAHVFQGDDVWKAGSLQVKNPLKLTFVESQTGIMDDAGNFLYADDSPELKTRNAMQSVARAFRNSYLLRGSFPQNADELAQAQITYKNPVSGKLEAPIIQIYRGDQGWSPTDPEEKSTFETSFEAGNLWTNEPPFLPGSVHTFLLAGAPSDDPGASSNRASVVIIKGADRNSAPIRLDEEKALLIVLTPKTERSTSSSNTFPAEATGSQDAIVTIRSGK